MTRFTDAAPDVETVLDARAEALARRREDPAQLTLHVVVILGDHRFAVVASRARHVSRARPITLAPSHLEAMAGVVPLHGTVLAAFDLSTVLGVLAAKPAPDRNLVVVDDGGEGMALLVDDVEGLAELDIASFDTDTTTGGLTRSGPGDLRLVDVDAVLSRLGSSNPPAHQPPGGHR